VRPAFRLTEPQSGIEIAGLQTPKCQRSHQK
jgi:hypothetical protein